MSKIYNNYTFLKGTFFFSLPGFFSIILSLISIPIYLKQVSTNVYSNFLLQHFSLTLSIVLNLGLSKIANIEIAKTKNKKSLDSKVKIIFLLSIIQSFFTCVILYLILRFVILEFKINNLYSLVDIKILFGLILTNIYLTLDSIIKGRLFYKLSAFSNLIFYSFSISAPIFFFIFFDVSTDYLFNVSLYIKFICLVYLVYFLLKKIDLFEKIKKNNFMYIFSRSYKWITLNLILQQIYNYFDKYLVKIFFSNTLFVFYSVSQQIASKFAIPFGAFNNIFLTLNSKSKGKTEQLIYSIFFYFFFINLIFFTLFPLLEPILKIWLNKNYNSYYLILIMIFFLTGSIGSLSNLLIDFYDINYESKKNLKIDLIIFFPFILLILFLLYKNNIYFIAFSILLKDIILIFVRIFPLNFDLRLKLFIIFQLLLFLIIIFFEILNYPNLLLIILQILIFFIFFPFKFLFFFLRKKDV